MSPPKRRETGILVSLFMRFSFFNWQQLLTSVVKQLPRLNRLPADQVEIRSQVSNRQRIVSVGMLCPPCCTRIDASDSVTCEC